MDLFIGLLVIGLIVLAIKYGWFLIIGEALGELIESIFD